MVQKGLNGRELAASAAKLASDKKANDVRVLDLRGLASFADYFVICSGESTQKVNAIADNIEGGLKKLDTRPLGVEGRTFGRWVLMDYADVIVHVFEEETRGFYELEKLWLDAPVININEDKTNLAGKDKRKVRTARH